MTLNRSSLNLANLASEEGGIALLRTISSRCCGLLSNDRSKTYIVERTFHGLQTHQTSHSYYDILSIQRNAYAHSNTHIGHIAEFNLEFDYKRVDCFI